MKERGEYGKFLPYSMGLGYYNFSSGIIYFPNVTKNEILQKGGYWYEEDNVNYDGTPSDTLPDNVKDITSDICAQALLCKETGYRYNIAPPELEFYQRKNIALPRTHFDVRILRHINKAAVLASYDYHCCFCNKKIEAYYPYEWNYKKISCEECYQKNLN